MHDNFEKDILNLFIKPELAHENENKQSNDNHNINDTNKNPEEISKNTEENESNLVETRIVAGDIDNVINIIYNI